MAAAKRAAAKSAGKSARGDDWKAAKEILTAHRTLARAEQREADVADALTTHTRTLADLRSGTKKADKQLQTAKGELHSSVKARKKAADRLAELERATVPAKAAAKKAAGKKAAGKKAAGKKAATKKAAGKKAAAKKAARKR